MSANTVSEFFNARLLAWEPLLEPWGARLELDVGVGARSEPVSSFFEGAQGLSSLGESGDQRQAVGQSGGAPRRVQGLPAPGARGAWGEVPKEGVDVSLRLVSEDTLNVNLTESLVENFAAVVHAHQRKDGTLEGTWAGGGSGDESFSLHWLRNETGLPLSFSAHCDTGKGGRREDGDAGSGSLPVQVSLGEEAPMPLLSAAFASREVSGGSGGGGDIAAVENDANNDATDAVESVASQLGDTWAAASCRGESSPYSSRVGRRSPSASPRSLDMVCSPRGSVCSSGISRRRRPVREVLLEVQEHEQGTFGRAAPIATTWRSLRPIDVDVVGQRLARMEVFSRDEFASSISYKAGTARSTDRSPWQPGSWNRVGAGLTRRSSRPVAKARAVKVVTEVESHHGVKVCHARFAARFFLSCSLS